MATWGELRLVMDMLHDVLEDTGDSVLLQRQTGGDRSQVVSVTRQVEPATGEEWVVLESPVALLSQVDLSRALELSEGLLCGGLSKRIDWLTVTHATPLSTMDPKDFTRPLAFVVAAADRLEEALLGHDEM